MIGRRSKRMCSLRKLCSQAMVLSTSRAAIWSSETGRRKVSDSPPHNQPVGRLLRLLHSDPRTGQRVARRLGEISESIGKRNKLLSSPLSLTTRWLDRDFRNSRSIWLAIGPTPFSTTRGSGCPGSYESPTTRRGEPVPITAQPADCPGQGRVRR